jgi:hypothetical protein
LILIKLRLIDCGNQLCAAVGGKHGRRERRPKAESEADVNTRKRAPVRATRPRSAITSGRQLFIDGDPTSAWSRRFHDLILGYINDLSAGRGANALAYAQLNLIRRASAIECELERLDAMLSRSEEVDMDAYARISGHLRRMWETLGLERKPKPVQTIDAFLMEREKAKAAKEASA